MTKKYLISVCIPVYNGEQFVEDCIKSVLSQDFRNYELLILDNCSNDQTKKIIKKFSDKRIRYVKNKTNIGSIRNFNKCIELARGQFFLLLPHDDMLLPGALNLFRYKLKDKKIGFVYSAIQTVDAKGKVIGQRMNLMSNEKATIDTAIFDIFKNFVPIQLAMVRTDILKNVGGFEPKYGVYCDIHLWLKILIAGWHVQYINENLFNHRVHENQGQNAFIKFNLKEASKHWGSVLTKSFWKQNTLNRFLLELLIYLKYELKNKSLFSNRLKFELTKIFMKGHIPSIAKNIIWLSPNNLLIELSLFWPLIKITGFYPIIFLYPKYSVYFIFDRSVGKLIRRFF